DKIEKDFNQFLEFKSYTFLKMDQDIILEYEERKRLISLLKGLPFENIVYSDYFKKPGQNMRHGMTEDKLKEIYPQFDKIIDVTKRPSRDGDKYCFVYRINKKISYYLIFRLDKKPKELFNAYPFLGNINERIGKKYLSHFFKPQRR